MGTFPHIKQSKLQSGVLVLYSQHTSLSVLTSNLWGILTIYCSTHMIITHNSTFWRAQTQVLLVNLHRGLTKGTINSCLSISEDHEEVKASTTRPISCFCAVWLLSAACQGHKWHQQVLFIRAAWPKTCIPAIDRGILTETLIRWFAIYDTAFNWCLK